MFLCIPQGKCAENPLLPRNIDEFMISTELIAACASLLAKQKLKTSSQPMSLSSFGKLYIQTNVEDVAVYVRGLVENFKSREIGIDCGFESIFTIPSSIDATYNLYRGRYPYHATQMESWVDTEASAECLNTRRRQRWFADGGTMAAGHGWLCQSILPKHGRTETEVVREEEGKPVHRIVFFVLSTYP